MTTTISINEGALTLHVDADQSLLEALKAKDIRVPSACGGQGRCGYCKTVVAQGGGPLTDAEEAHLTDDDRAAKKRLACQVRTTEDLFIQIPEKRLKAKTYQGRVTQKKMVTHDIALITITLDDKTSFDFRAGQYVQLETKPYADHPAVARAYSIASSPSRSHAIDLLIRQVPGGIVSTWVVEHMSAGDGVCFSGPFGDFHLSDTDAPIIAIAGGSGMSPIWSILQHMCETQNPRPITYFFGALTQRDLFFVDELQALEKEMPHVSFVPALSAEPEESDWSGERGLITDVVAKHVPDASLYEAYLCGSPGMIHVCLDVLTTNGLTEDNIFFDKFA